MTYPTIMPALTLDFANSQQLDPRISFSRSSSGTYVDSSGLIKTAADNVARFDHDPVTGESLGLLMEESRTNSLDYSEDFTQSYWTKQECSLGATTTAPDGISNAYLVIPNATDTQNHRLRTSSSGLSQQRSQSCFAKAGGYNYVVFKSQNVDCIFDLSTGTATNGGKMIPLANGWYRCVFTGSTYLGSGVGWGCSPNAGGAGSGNGTDGVYLWGLQWEDNKNFETSYIPTSGSTVTRAADVAKITGDNFSSWYNQNEGAYLIEAIGPAQRLYYLSSFRGNSGNRGMDFRVSDDNGRIQLHAIDGANIAINNSYMTGCNIQDGVKVALTYDAGVLSARGSNSTITPTLNPSQVNSLPIPGIKSLQFSYSNYTYHLKRVAYYNERLTDAELQTLTS